jgi:hypothetical protein
MPEERFAAIIVEYHAEAVGKGSAVIEFRMGGESVDTIPGVEE